MTSKERKALDSYMDAVEEAILGLRTEVAELKRSNLRYRAVWSRSQDYERGDLATHGGTLWFCARSTTDKPGTSDAWQLMAKSGS